MTTKYFTEPPADLSSLAPPPVPAGLDLRHFDCMHLDTNRLLNADIWDDCSGDEIATALRLWAQAWRQVPCSSLPNDDRKLQKLAGLEGKPKRWRVVRFGALRGFHLADDGRLYHHVIAETATKAASKSRAGKRGAKVRWGDVKPLKDNKTGNATASSRVNGRGDDTLYSNTDGRTDAISMQRREENTLTSLPPLSSAAGSGSPVAHPDRPPRRPQAPKPTQSNDHGVELTDGRVCVHYPTATPGEKPARMLWIDRSGIVDIVDLESGLEPLELTAKAALDLRRRALERPPDARVKAAAELEQQGAT